MTVVARTEDLRKLYGDRRAQRAALDGISIEVKKGEFLCVLGPSGSGKSTLLGILGGLDRDYDGRCYLFGDNIALMDDRALAALRGRRIGFVFQAFHLLPDASVLDNVLTPSLFGERVRGERERAADLL